MSLGLKRSLILPFTIIGSVLVAACGSPEDSETDELEAGERVEVRDRVALTEEALGSLELTYVPAEIMDLAPSLEVPAEIVPVPDRMASVGSRVSGRVAGVVVNTGDFVERGDPLVVLESADVGRAWADLISARAKETVARQARDRQESLLTARVTSERAFEEADGAFRTAEAEVEAALTRLAAYGIRDAEAEDVPDDPGRITLRAPLRGTVTRRLANVGAWVEPADMLIELVDLDDVWVAAAVYEGEMRFVEVDQVAEVEVRAFPGDVFKGSVVRVEGVLDENTRSVGVRIELPNPEHDLRPGMFATVRIRATRANESRQMLGIPWAAVQRVDEHQVVFVPVDEGVFEVRTVHTGVRSGDFVEILTGLAPGEEVVSDGSFLLKGQLLRSTLAEEEEG